MVILASRAIRSAGFGAAATGLLGVVTGVVGAAEGVLAALARSMILVATPEKKLLLAITSSLWECFSLGCFRID